MVKTRLYYKHDLFNLVASATASGYSVDNLLIPLESSLWKGVGTGNHFIIFDAGEGAKIGFDYLGIVGHNLAGATIQLQYSDDDFSADFNDAIFKAIDSFSSPPGGLPTGIAVDPNGTLWTSDFNALKIYNIKKDGTPINDFPASTSSPQDIAVDPNGTLWECSSGNSRIYNIKKDGTPISNFPSPSTNISGIAVDPNDTLWTCDLASDKIYNTKKDGTPISNFPASDNVIRGIAVDPNGTLWTCDSSSARVYNIKKDGTPINDFPASHSSPQDIAVDPNGTLWECNDSSTRIYNFNKPFPIDNKPILKEFPLVSERYVRIKLSNLTEVPFIAMMQFGLKVDLDFPDLFDPDAEVNKAVVNISPTGKLLGINNKFIEAPLIIKFKGVEENTALWNNIKRYNKDHGLNLLFTSWDIDTHPEHIYLVSSDARYRAPFISATHRTVTLNLRGRNIFQ